MPEVPTNARFMGLNKIKLLKMHMEQAKRNGKLTWNKVLVSFLFLAA